MGLLTLPVIARRALATLYNNTVLAGLVYRDYDPEFAGKQGDTVTVRVPATFTANQFDRSAGIVLQTPNETSFDVKLDTILDVSFPITAEDLTLKLDNFAERLLNPAMEAINQGVDVRLAEALADAAEAVGGGGVATATGTSLGDRHKAYRTARRILSRNKLPLTERYAVLSPEGVEAVTSDQLVLQANTAGSTDALRESAIGRLSGFDNFESQVLGSGPNDAGQADGLAFHRSAVALASRTLEAPMGVAANQYAIENYKGLGVRVVKAYDITKKQDVISIDMLIGVVTVRKQAVVELDFGQGS